MKRFGEEALIDAVLRRIEVHRDYKQLLYKANSIHLVGCADPTCSGRATRRLFVIPPAQE